jgi:hypothetical protein
VPVGQRRLPFPRSNLKNEAGTCNDPDTCGDHHLLVVEQGACRLWEGYHTYKLNGQWYTMSSAAWDLKSLSLRPSSWTSGDAAGLPITPFLAKAAEADSGEIRHALRVTFRDAVLANAFTWPARHAAGSSAGGGWLQAQPQAEASGARSASARVVDMDASGAGCGPESRNRAAPDDRGPMRIGVVGARTGRRHR